MTAPLLLGPHSKDLGGGFVVRRLLPAGQRQAVGPYHPGRHYQRWHGSGAVRDGAHSVAAAFGPGMMQQVSNRGDARVICR